MNTEILSNTDQKAFEEYMEGMKQLEHDQEALKVEFIRALEKKKTDHLKGKIQSL